VSQHSLPFVFVITCVCFNLNFQTGNNAAWIKTPFQFQVPSRSLPRSQNSSVRSGRRSVEPAAAASRTAEEHLRPPVAQSVPASRTASNSSLAAGSDVSTARSSDGRKLSAGSRLAPPTSLTKMKAKSSRDNLVATSRPGSSKEAGATKISPTAASGPKSRCQSIPRAAATAVPTASASPVVADGSQTPAVAAKSAVATVRQLSLDTAVDHVSQSTDGKHVPPPCDDITIHSDASSLRTASTSRMPRFSGRPTASRSAVGGNGSPKDAAGVGTVAAVAAAADAEPCGPAQPASNRQPVESRVSGTESASVATAVDTSQSSTVGNGSPLVNPEVENVSTRTTDTGIVDDASSIKPMQPMTSRSYLFTPTPFDVESPASPSNRLLSASRRPFPSVSIAPTGSRAAGTLCSGYVSDGDMSGRNGYQLQRYSGYMSEGGSTLYANRRMQQSFLDSIDGMRKCLERGLADVDDDDDDDDDR
jgi:hypothetical protein